MTTSVFADTGYWVALLDPKDQLHSSAIEVSRTLGKRRIVTSEMVLAEFLNLLAVPALREQAGEAVEQLLRNPNVEVIPQTGLQFRDALTFYRMRPDKAWSLTDCASFVIMQQRNLKEALAFDHHFEQAGFVALLRDQ
jgi:uncharacterized protein